MRKLILIVALLIIGFSTYSATPKKRSSFHDSTLKVMTFNMRYDNKGDGDNRWDNRKERVANAINFYSPDILGAQELLDHQYEYLKAKLPEYSSIGVGRDDGVKGGEYNPLFYNKKRFELVKSGTFWLSATPEVVSRGWDGACNRLATWAVLKDRKSGRQVFAMNTHLDHVGKEARSQGVKLLLERAKLYSGGRPIFITGDFNSTPESDVVAQIKGSGIKDSREISPVVYGPDWSYHNWEGYDYKEKSLIDYIFTDGQLATKSYGVVAETHDGKYLTDHCPVIATFVY